MTWRSVMSGWQDDAVSPAGGTWKHDLVATAKPLSAAMTAGFLTGAIVGGIGGRLAMLVLRLTSDPALHGRETDDGFRIGIFSGATLFLIALTAIAGTIGGLLYLAVRPWFPARARPWVFGVLVGVVGGAIFIRPDGLDFTLLEPLGLAIAMFVALPASYGVVVSLVAERFLASDSRFRGSRAWIAGLVLLLPFPLFGPVGLVIIVPILVAFVVGRRAAPISPIWTSRPVVWIARTAVAGVGVLALFALADDVGQIL